MLDRNQMRMEQVWNLHDEMSQSVSSHSISLYLLYRSYMTMLQSES